MVLSAAARIPGVPPRNPHVIDDLLDQYGTDIAARPTLAEANALYLAIDGLSELLVTVTADDSTDNATAIQSKLDLAGALVGTRYGRTVIINAIGTVRIGTALTVPKGVTLAGRGSQATSLKPTAGFTDPYLIRMGAGASQYEHAIGVRDLRLYIDNHAAIEDAIYTTTANEPSFVERVRIEDYAGRAFHAERVTIPSTQQPSHIRISDCEFMASVDAPMIGTDESVLLDTVGNTTLIHRITVTCMDDAKTAGTRRLAAIRAIDTAVRVDSVHTEQHERGLYVTKGALNENGMASVAGLTGHPSVDDVVYIDDTAPHEIALVSPHGATRTLTNTITGEARTGVLVGYIYPVATPGTYHADVYGSVQAALTAAGAAGGGTVIGNPATTYAQTTTLTVPAGVTLSKVTLTFTGAPETAGYSAIWLNGDDAIVERCNITVLSGDYRRTIWHNGHRTKTMHNTINSQTADINAAALLSIIFAAKATEMLDIVIEGNDITCSGTDRYGDAVQSSRCPGIAVRNNTFHDFAEPVPHFSWVVYLSTGCYNAIIEGNYVRNWASGGLRMSAGDAAGTLIDRGRRVINNVIEDVRWIGIGLTYTSGAEVAGNTVLRAGQLISVLDSPNTTIHDNHVTEATTENPVLSSNQEMITCSSADCVFHSNVIGARGLAIRGIYTTGPRNILTDNQFLAGRPRHAIHFGTDASDGQARGGVIEASDDATKGAAIITSLRTRVEGVRINQPSVSGWIGVSAGATASGTIVRGCHLTGGTNGVWISNAGAVGCQIIDTIIDGTTSAIISNSGTGTIIHHTGAGAPAIAAGVGSTWRRTDGGAGTTFYVNETGTSTWRAV